MAEIDNEDVVKRFTLPIEDYTVDETEEIKPFGATLEQQHEMRLAFELISDGNENISASQIDDLFLSIGYTLQESELATLIDQLTPDEYGKYTAEVLVDAYDTWKKEQLEERSLAAVFYMLSKKEKVLPKIPLDCLRLPPPDKKSVQTEKIQKKALQSLLGSVLYHDPGSLDVTDDDVLGLVDEIATTAAGSEDINDPYITYEDFLSIFKKS
jgi:Ca2+-binding EF-hand superfamily protein